jgi:hypothetical protein
MSAWGDLQEKTLKNPAAVRQQWKKRVVRR